MADVVQRWLCNEAPDDAVVAAVKTLDGALTAAPRGCGDMKLLRVVAEKGGPDVSDAGKEEMLGRLVTGICSQEPQEMNDALQLWRCLLDRTLMSREQHVGVLGGILDNTLVQDWDQTMRLLFFGSLEKYFALTPVPTPPGGFGAEFAYAFIRAIDGERDPRCLLATFRLHAQLCKNLNPDVIQDPRVVEELFDVVSCYFPIAYTPPKKEANPVKKADLKEAVLECCTHRAFAEYAIPFALDKMVSPIGETKHDSLAFLRRCCERWGLENPLLLEPYHSDIWPQLRTETLQATIRGDTYVLNELFMTVTSVCKCIAALGDEGVVLAHMQHLLDGVLNMVSVREGFVNAKAYSALVHFAAASSWDMCVTVTKRLALLLEGAFKEKQEDFDRRTAIISIFNALLGAIATYPLGTEGHDSDAAGLKEYVMTMKRCVIEVLRMKAGPRSGFEEQVLCAEACSSLVQAFADEEAADGLVSLALNASEQSSKMVLDALKAATRVPKADAPKAAHFHVHHRVRVEDDIIPKLVFVKPYDESSARAALFVIIREAANALALLKTCLQGAAREASPFLLELMDAVATFAANHHTADALRPSNAASYNVSTQVFLRCADRVKDLATGGAPLVKGLQLCCAVLLTPSQQQEVLSQVEEWSEVWCALVCAATDGVPVPQIDGAVISAERLHDFSGNASLAVASRLNKGFAPVLPDCWATSPAVGVVCRGGAMVAGKTGMEYIQALVQLCTKAKHTEPQPSLAKQFESVFSTETIALSPALGHRASALWRQKVYNYALPELLKAYNEAGNGASRANIFAAMSVLVQHAPPSIIAADAARLIPILSEGLAASSDNIMISSLSILNTIVSHDPASVGKVPLLRTLVPSLLKASTYRPSKSVRRTALGVLNTIATNTAITTAAVAFKQDVVNGLRLSIADHKRCVRAAATLARSSWYLLA